MDDERLTELEALADAADAGPWEARDDGHVWFVPGVVTGCKEANAKFVAAARTALPELVAEVRRLQTKLGQVRQAWFG